MIVANTRAVLDATTRQSPKTHLPKTGTEPGRALLSLGPQPDFTPLNLQGFCIDICVESPSIHGILPTSPSNSNWKGIGFELPIPSLILSLFERTPNSVR